MTPEALAKARAEVVSAVERLAGLAERAGVGALAAELRGPTTRKLVEDEVQLVVVGEFNRGKSSVINALLGANVLETGITPTTETLQLVRFASEATQVRRADGALEVGWPAPILETRTTLVDTPGVNDLSEQRAEITYGILPRADAVLVVLDATQAMTESERQFLASRVLRGTRERLLFALNKADRLDAAELAEVLAFVKKHLEGLVPDPLVFPISARRRLEAIGSGQALRPADASDDPDGFIALEARIGRLLAEDRPRLVADHAIAGGLRAAAYLREALGIRRSTAALAVADLEAKVARLHEELEVTVKQLRGFEQRIRDECGAAKALVRGDLHEFSTTFQRVLPAEIDGVDGEDVQRYLAPFIEDKLREWVEAEGERLAARLEALAEEIVALANDEVSRALGAVARELGPEVGKVDFQVDSLKYDASVFALGAFGTTLLFFARGLAGGLLALATPIVAAVLRARLGKQIKDQAKALGPTAIAKATDAIGPKLDDAIDDFAARLGAFIVEAGLRLRRAVTEVLERALADRRQGAQSEESVRAQVDAEAEEVAAVERTLRELRDGLWASSTD